MSVEVTAAKVAPSPERRRAMVMYAGLAVSVLALAVPLIDLATADSLTAHVRAAYPDWSASLVAADHNAIIVYLSIVNGLGVVGWLSTIRGVTKGAKWARITGTILFGLGALVALYNVSATGGEYANVIPYPYSTLGLLPVVVGAAAVVMVWRAKR
ncbi:hypothetical protein [Stackebrandtia nassauensis]|uniref:Uncharacterized protein n=1 Tax=Stackebrandtia nassauensis (strain DSM 44728 / CIP 108903 / NRRL B-16338 / NBRC 102104 / LLR-40K-21) TaxID=446470 RepID=D3Q2R7_STANL|nr:hypothetical protein [Stackebrandtia nassauensis]ADD45818.1 hypothetical protein Snas_6195 [Stackebrandtia nassauensis DSM 44728]